MLEISRSEVAYLAKHGLKWGKDLHGTVHARHYYMTEKSRNINALNEYRNKTIKLVGENPSR